jgi:flavin reductase (DIM6/NTAB) family NADH-FMN oxidoreductase RutF
MGKITLTKEEINALPKADKINLINSISGIKPGNLIGTISNEGLYNLAIFSSVVHLGSAPALLGFILRPNDDTPRHTYLNLKDNGKFSLNSIHRGFSQNAHYTSVKFPAQDSEFEKCKLEMCFYEHHKIPFVKQSKRQLAMNMVDDIYIAHNKTRLIVAEIEEIMLDQDILQPNFRIDFEKSEELGIAGLNSYYQLQHQASYPYARASELPLF